MATQQDQCCDLHFKDGETDIQRLVRIRMCGVQEQCKNPSLPCSWTLYMWEADYQRGTVTKHKVERERTDNERPRDTERQTYTKTGNRNTEKEP